MPDIEPQGATHRQYAFDWQKFGAVQAVTREFLDEIGIPPGVARVSVTTVEDPFRDLVFARLKAYVLTHQLAEHGVTRSRTVEWPATPWQHFKKRHAESWWLRWLVARRPVRMQHEVVDFQEAWTELAAYPWQTHLPPFPKLGRPNRVVLSDVRWTPPSEADRDV